MYKVITYKDRAGNDEVAEYIQELNGKIKTNFVKKSQKTSPREIERAERNLKDFLERYGE